MPRGAKSAPWPQWAWGHAPGPPLPSPAALLATSARPTPLDLALSACSQDLDFLSQCPRRLLHVVQLHIKGRLGRIEEHCNRCVGWNKLAQQSEPLCSEYFDQVGNPRDITTGPVVTGDQANFDWVLAA